MPSPGLPDSGWFQVDGCKPQRYLEQAVLSALHPCRAVHRKVSLYFRVCRWGKMGRVRNNGEKEKVILSQFVLAQ